MAKLCMAHASTHDARKPPGPIFDGNCIRNTTTMYYNYSVFLILFLMAVTDMLNVVFVQSCINLHIYKL